MAIKRAIKKLVVNGVSLTYDLQEVSAGNYRVFVTDSTDRVRQLDVTDVLLDAQKKNISFKLDGRLVIARVTDTGANWQVMLARALGPILVQELGPVVTKMLPEQKKQSNELRSPLAGRITKLMVTVGQEVSKGQQLLMIESMKMENELCAVVDGYIKTILIQEGDVVQPHQVLIVFDNQGAGDAAPESEYESESVQNRRSGQ